MFSSTEEFLFSVFNYLFFKDIQLINKSCENICLINLTRKSPKFFNFFCFPVSWISGKTEVGSTAVLLYRSTFFSTVIGTVGTFFWNVSFLVPSYFFLTSLIGTRYSVLLLWFVWNGAFIYSNSVQIKWRRSEDNRRPTPLATECGSGGYGTTAVCGVTKSTTVMQ